MYCVERYRQSNNILTIYYVQSVHFRVFDFLFPKFLYVFTVLFHAHSWYFNVLNFRSKNLPSIANKEKFLHLPPRHGVPLMITQVMMFIYMFYYLHQMNFEELSSRVSLWIK